MITAFAPSDPCHDDCATFCGCRSAGRQKLPSSRHQGSQSCCQSLYIRYKHAMRHRYGNCQQCCCANESTNTGHNCHRRYCAHTGFSDVIASWPIKKHPRSMHGSNKSANNQSVDELNRANAENITKQHTSDGCDEEENAQPHV